MTSQILKDAEARPDLFHWFGGVERSSLLRWCSARGLMLPEDLVALFEATGGGDLFETETILGPLSGQNTADDADTANAEHEIRGPTGEFWLYHVGFVYTAVRRS